MNGVTYADALVKARRYEEIMNESSNESVNEFFVEAANVICEAACEENIMLDEEVNFDVLVEAVVDLMSDEQLAMENVEEFVIEAATYILNEFKKVKEKKAAEKAAKLLKRATQSELAGGIKADELKKDAGKAVLKAHNLVNRAGGDEDTKAAAKETLNKAFDAVKKSKEEGKLAGSFAGKGRDLSKKDVVSPYVQKAREQRSLKKLKAAEAAAKAAANKEKAASKAAEIVKKATEEKNLPAVINNGNASEETKANFKDKIASAAKTAGSKVGDAAKATGKWMKDHKAATAGIGAGVAAATAGGIDAAKKIADHKKAAAAAKEKEKDVKENYEYPEYAELVEFVISNLTEEEIMQENASEFACEVADYMIEAEMKADVDAKVIGSKVKETIGSKLSNAAKTAGGKVGDAAKATGKWMKDHKAATAGIGAGVAATGAAAAIAAKKIADKKKAAQQNQEEVKENCEYDEYETLVEAVVECFMSEEEIMSENASQIAIATADYLIDNIDNI